MQEDTQQEVSSVASHPRRISFDTAAVWALIGAVGLASITFIPSAVVPFLYTKVSVLAFGGLVALVCYILARLRQGNVIVPPLPLLGALWLVPAAYALSTLFSGERFSASFFGTDLETDTLGFMVLLAAFASLAALSFRRAAQYRAFFKAGMVVAGVVMVLQVLFIIVSKIMPDKISATANTIGTLADLGMFLGLAIITGLLAQRFLTLPSRVRTLTYVGGGLALALLVLVNAVYVWILVALVALGLFIESIMRRTGSHDDADFEGVASLGGESRHDMNDSDSRSMVAPLVTLLVSLFFIIGGSTVGNALVSAAGTSVLDVRPSWQSTFMVGSHTYASSPVFGSGPGTFSQEWLQFRDRSLNDTVFWNVDFAAGIGAIPTSFVTTGIIGVIAWLVFLGLFLFIGARALLFRIPSDSFLRFVSLSSFTGALYVLVLAVVTTPGPVVLMCGFLMLGVFISSLRYGSERREFGVIFSRSPRIGFIVVFGLTLLLLASVVASYVVVERYLGSLAFSQASVAYGQGNYAEAATKVNQSLVFAPSARAYQLSAATSIARMRAIVSDTKLAPADAQQQFQAELSSAIAAMGNATRDWPNDYQNWLMLGNVYQTVVPLNIEGAYDNAKASFERAVMLAPTNPTIPFVIAQLEIAKGNAAPAEEALVKSITLKKDYTQAIFLLSQLQAQQGKAKEALQAAEAAAYFAPNDPVVFFQVGILRSANRDTDGAISALTRAVQLNPQYANAYFFLGVMYAQKGLYTNALEALNTVAGFSQENATAVASDIAALTAGKNPFPASRLGALGIPQGPVAEPAQ